MSREAKHAKGGSKSDQEISNPSAIEHILRYRPQRIKTLYLSSAAKSSSNRASYIIDLAKQARIAIDSSPHPGGEPIRALLMPYEYAEFDILLETLKSKSRSLVVALDHLQDPQNLGAICRSAEGLGVSAVLLPKDRGVLVSSGAYHASVGAVETLPIALVGNLGDALRKLKDAGFWVVGTKLGKGTTLLEGMPNFEKVVLVLGAEWEGLSPGMEKTCDWLLEIPLRGKIQSLNVSAAGAILMYELLHRK